MWVDNEQGLRKQGFRLIFGSHTKEKFQFQISSKGLLR